MRVTMIENLYGNAGTNDDAIGCVSLRWAKQVFAEHAEEAARFSEQPSEAWLFSMPYEDFRDEYILGMKDAYPDRLLTIGPRGGVRSESC
jgi:hypothetical protein